MTISKREEATLIWLVVLLCFLITKKDVRQSICHLFRSMCNFHIILSFSAYFIYISIGLYLFSTIGLWGKYLAKDTLLWIVLTGMSMLMRFGEASKDPHFFRKEAKRVFAVSVFIEFFLGLQSFSLPLELVLVPLAAALTITAALPDSRPGAVDSQKSASRLLSIVGIFVLLATLWEFAKSVQDKNLGELGRSLLLVVWLPLYVLPFIAAFCLFAFYELAFMRMDWRREPSIKSWKPKVGLLLSLRTNVSDVGSFAGPWPNRVAETTTIREAKLVSDRYKCSRRINGDNLWTE